MRDELGDGCIQAHVCMRVDYQTPDPRRVFGKIFQVAAIAFMTKQQTFQLPLPLLYQAPRRFKLTSEYALIKPGHETGQF